MTPGSHHQVEAVLFDVNHTLIGIRDEDSVQRYAVDRMFELSEPAAPPGLSLAAFRAAYDKAWNTGRHASFERYRESRYEDIVADALDELGIKLTPVELEKLLQGYMEPLYSSAYIIEGMADLLDELRGRYRLAAVTNYKYANGMRGLLRRTGLERRLDSVTISSEIGWKKPAPEIYREALATLGVSARSCIFVGNELEKDLWQASELGMRIVLFTPPEHGSHDAEFAEILKARLGDDVRVSDYAAESVRELRDVLRRVLATS